MKKRTLDSGVSYQPINGKITKSDHAALMDILHLKGMTLSGWIEAKVKEEIKNGKKEAAQMMRQRLAALEAEESVEPHSNDEEAA